jgi:hypothetical protein
MSAGRRQKDQKMTHTIRPLDCERARAHTSLHLDGELSELEAAGLDAHLAGCAACRAYAVTVVGATGQLRAAAYERPTRQIVIPSLRARLRGLQVGAAAAAIVLAAGLGTALGVVRSNTFSATGLGGRARPAFADSGYAEVRAIHKSQQPPAQGAQAFRRTAI